MEAAKTTFWPMVGGISEGFTNYLAIVREVDAKRPTRQALEQWLIARYGIKQSYARNVVSLLLFGTGLLESDGKCCKLTPAGQELLKSGAPSQLYRMVADRFIGIDNLVAIVEARQPITGEELQGAWEAEIRQKCSISWNSRHAAMQFKHRLDWLRSLGMINKVADEYYLAKAGIRELTRRRVQTTSDERGAEEASHNDIEDKLKAIGEFFEFVSVKRAPVNDARPVNTPRLSENRQLDCLWARVIQFGGRVQYAFEVQLSGNISDAIERLEMVASFVQKAVVVTDEEQQARIQDRLAVKHSPLRDKILYLSYEDIENVVEAVNALRVFTKKIFQE